jgi:hypothetical protein
LSLGQAAGCVEMGLLQLPRRRVVLKQPSLDRLKQTHAISFAAFRLNPQMPIDNESSCWFSNSSPKANHKKTINTDQIPTGSCPARLRD